MDTKPVAHTHDNCVYGLPERAIRGVKAVYECGVPRTRGKRWVEFDWCRVCGRWLGPVGAKETK
jgi:hypothetical protein